MPGWKAILDHKMPITQEKLSKLLNVVS